MRTRDGRHSDAGRTKGHGVGTGPAVRWSHSIHGVMEPNRRILVLGPPAIAVEGSIVAVSGRRVQGLLAALVLSVNHAIRIERLIEIVWPGGEPASGANALQSHVSKLRSLLGEDAIVSTDHCYALVADCAEVDACAFEHSVVGALDVMDAEPRQARSMLLEALSLWRGPAYAELADEDPFRIEAMRLEELRSTAVEAELACDVALGDLVRAIGRLRSALADECRDRARTRLFDGFRAK